MRLSKKILLVLAVCVIVASLLGRYFVYVPVVEPPPLTGALADHALDIGGLDRHFAVYRPDRPLESAAAVIMLHGARGSGKRIRRGSGYGLDLLADRHGFIVVYPEGYERHWNDCRAAAQYQAKLSNVDDVAFMRELVSFIAAEYAVDRNRVFVAGLSNGGQMAYRLALEAPDLVRGIAVIAASMPTQENMSCIGSGKAVPVMIINGTADPINPYGGGEVTLVGPFGSRGDVMSAQASAQYWARLAQYSTEPFFHRYPDNNADDGSVAERMVWTANGRPEVALVTVDGGGHTIPGPGLAFPFFLGSANQDFSAVDEIWRFFSREAAAPAL
jgi:polyhydroxybutyrate depolymerase